MKIENIKFKAKRLYNGKWAEGDLTHDTDGMPLITLWNGCCKDENGTYVTVKVAPSTICQFTGTKDANGTDLYENDIIHFKGYKPTGVIKWVDDACAFMVEYDGNLDYLSNVLDVGKVERLGSTQDKEDNSYED